MIDQRTVIDLKDQIKAFLGDKKAIIGLSGGIDSSVVAYLCVEAIGKENVIGLHMPYKNQGTEDSVLIEKSLGIESVSINIGPIVDSFPIIVSDNDKLVKGNIMARIRMVLLYQYANAYNGMVMGTTNKAEAEIGYYTKYGDGAVDVEPIADLYKREVRELAVILGVPERIIKKAPSAGLWNGQTDEGEIGMTYDELDEILKVQNSNMAHLREYGDISPDGRDLLRKYGNDKIRRVEGLIRGSNHKKRMPPAFKAKK